MNTAPPTGQQSNQGQNPEKERHILLRPQDWVPPQLEGLIPATRNAVNAITTLPRDRLTLLVALATTMAAAAAVFAYLLLRRQ